jgi:hypothetical protein
VAADQRFIGGMRGPRLSRLERGANATWPLVELRIEDGHGSLRVRVPGLRSLVHRWLPSFEFAPAAVRVEACRGALGRGVRIKLPAEPEVIFWTPRTDEVLAAFAAAGAQPKP